MSKPPPKPPRFTSPSGRFYLWPAVIAHAARTPNTWLLVLPDVPLAAARQVTERRHPDLRRTDGALAADPQNVHVHDGRERCDLYVKWIPTPKEDR